MFSKIATLAIFCVMLEKKYQIIDDKHRNQYAN